MKLAKRFVALIGCLGFAVAIAGQAGAAGMGYVQTDLVTDLPALAAQTGAHLDPNLKNPWGIAFFPGLSPFWINENNAGFSALYFADGVPFPLANVTIPAPTMPTGGTPTGIVANFFVASGAFPIGTSGPSLFIFATEDGTIEAWNTPVMGLPITLTPDPDLDFPFTDDATIVVDNSAGGGPTGAVYKGLALGANVANGPLLYATNFRTGNVDVFDTNFHQVTLGGSFTDPKLQHGYAPFGIQNINGKILVTYAMQDKPKHDPVNKPGHGFVDVFDTDGNLLQRFAQHGHLNSPWGVALAPKTFGKFANDMLIGNFDDGRINAFDPKTGHWLGALAGPDGRPLVNDGLWSLTFGGALNSDPDNDMDNTVSSPGTLFFSAGLNDEADGLFGSIVPE